MNELAEKIGRALVPEKSRRFLTFRRMTLFVAICVLWNLAMLFVLKPTPQSLPQWARSSVFLILYNTAVVIGFLVIYLTRKKPRYYAARAVFYGMLLAGVVGELLSFAQVDWQTVNK